MSTHGDTHAGVGVAVLGAGGHAKVIVATLRAMGRAVVGCYVRDDAERARTPALLGVPVYAEDALPADCDVVIATGDNALRMRLARKLAGRSFARVVHPSAIVDASVTVDEGAMICAGVVLQVDVKVGAHAIVNTAAHIDHDGVVGAFAHVAPGAHLAGDVTIEEGAFVGTGASVIPGRRVGAWATVGAGAVVLRDVAERDVVVGVPARARSSKAT